jgi:hypothetical protein
MPERSLSGGKCRKYYLAILRSLCTRLSKIHRYYFYIGIVNRSEKYVTIDEAKQHNIKYLRTL